MPYKNIEDRRAAQRRWYANNSDKAKGWVKKNTKKHRKQIREWIKSLKRELSCERCGEDHVATLHFHHINPSEKEFTIAQAASWGHSKTRILEEIKKCECLCANCHAKEHWQV